MDPASLAPAIPRIRHFSLVVMPRVEAGGAQLRMITTGLGCDSMITGKVGAARRLRPAYP